MMEIGSNSSKVVVTIEKGTYLVSMKVGLFLFCFILMTLSSIYAQVPHGSIGIEEPQIGVFEIFPDYGNVKYMKKKEIYVFEHHNNRKDFIQVDTLIDSSDSLKNRSVIHRDGWVNFGYQKNRLYSSLIIQGVDSMLVYVFTGTGNSEADKFLSNRYVVFENILLENIIFKKGTTLINIFDEDLRTLKQAYLDDKLPIDNTLVIQGELIVLNNFTDQVLTTVKIEHVLNNRNIGSLPKEYAILTDCFDKN